MEPNLQIKEITLKNLTIKNNVFLAPVAGYTDRAFRSVALSCGYGMCFTELVSAKGLVLNPQNNPVLWSCDGAYDKTAVQIFGSDPYYMRSAIESEQLKDYKVVDINMGCPVPKVYKNGEGCALLKNVLRAELIIKECVKSGKIITIKIRTGQVAGDNIAKEFSVMAENAGASLITIHGRVREAYYSGEPDYKAIYQAKKSVNIPVIANGGVFTKQDASDMIDKTGADGVMLARGGFSNPFLVCELLGKEPPTNLKSFIISHLTEMIKDYGERKAGMEFKKFAPWYFKGMLGLSNLKKEINLAENAMEIIEKIQQTL